MNNIQKLKQLQINLDECNENCDIITHIAFGRSETPEERESYAINRLKSEALQKEIKRVIESL